MSETESHDTEEQVEDIPLHERDPDEVSVEELEEQEWTLGGGPAKELINFKGTVFKIEEPENDDVILNLMAEAEMGAGATEDRMFKLCKAAISGPELTAERWRDLQMSERIGLMTRVSGALGMGDMLDFQELGQQLREDD